MIWLFQFAKTGRIKTMAEAIKTFFKYNGRMPSSKEIKNMEGVMREAQGKTADIIQFPKDRITPFHKPRPTKAEIEAEYRRLSSLSPEEVKVEMKKAGLTPVEEKPLLKDSPEAIAKIKAENKAAAERLRKKKEAEELFTDERPPKDPDFASGGIARVGYANGSYKSEGLFGIPMEDIRKFKEKERMDRTSPLAVPDDWLERLLRKFRRTKTYEQSMESGGIARVGMMIGGFTKAQVLIQMLKNTLKGSKDAYVKKTFPNFIKELQKNPSLANNENVWKNLTTGLPKNQRLIVHSDDSVDFFTQTEFGPHNIQRTLDFQKKHNLSREQANKILRMEPEDRVLEMKRLETIRNRTKNASGGIAGPLHLYDGGRAGFKKGGFDPSKRKFLKGTGAALGVLSMLPFVGKFFKPAAKAVGKFKGTPNLVVDITKTPNMPEWYIPLIKKVLNKGEEVTDKAATVARERVHRDILPDGDQVTVTQNIDNQTISVNVENPNSPYLSSTGAGESPYTIQYSKGKVIEEGKMKGKKTPDTLEVDEPYVQHSGPDDVEVQFDINTYNPKAEVHDTSVLESYATGKKVKSRGSGEVYDPYEGYSPDLKADKAEGGLAHVLGV